MEKVNIPLVGNCIIRGWDTATNFTEYTKGQLFVNHEFYTTENPITGKQGFFSQHRPGFVDSSTPADFSQIDRMFPWFGYNNSTGSYVTCGMDTATGRTRLLVSGVAYSYVYAANSLQITHITETKNSSGTDSIIVTRGATGYGADYDYYLYPRGGAMAAISMPSGSKGRAVTIKGWTFVGNIDGKIYNSNLNDPSTGYTDFIGTDMFPDGVVDMEKIKDHLVVFGRHSVDVFEIVDNATGSPLRHMPQYHQHTGLVELDSDYATSLVAGNSYLYFVSANGETPRKMVHELNGSFQLKEVSKPHIRNLIEYGLIYVRLGAKHYLITKVDFSASLTHALVYDIELDLWHVWLPADFSVSWNSFCNIPGADQIIGQGDGALNTLFMYGETHTSHSFQDTGTVPTRSVITEKMDFGSANWKTINYIRLLGDQVSSAASVSISWSDDDGQTFSTARTLDLSSSDPTIWGCGATRRRIFKVEDALDGEYRYSSLEVGYTPNEH